MTGFKREACSPVASIKAQGVFAGRGIKSVRGFCLNDRSADLAFGPAPFKAANPPHRVIASGGTAAWRSSDFHTLDRALFLLDCFASLAMTGFKREACSPVASIKAWGVFA